MDIDLQQFGDIPPVTREAWEEAVAKALGTSTLDRLRAVTADGIAVPPLSPPASGRRSMATRGAGKPWSIVQRVLLEDPAQANADILDELSNGADAIDLIFGSSWHSHFSGLDDLDLKLGRAFEGVYLDMITVHMGGSGDVLPIGNILVAVAERAGRDPAKVLIRSTYDPIAANATIHAPKPIQNVVFADTDKLARSTSDCTRWASILSCSGQSWHAAGATEVQQIAIAIATASTFIELWSNGRENAIPLSEFPARIAVRLVADQNQFLTIAKLRAFRRLWALLLDAWGLPQTAAHLHAETAWRMMTRRDPWVNILRSTVATFGAAVGGADAITTVPHTALLGRPDSAARRLSRNVQTVLMDESNLHRVADPGAGSGAIEQLTDALAEAAWEEFRQIEREGGLLASLEAGAISGRILAAEEKRRTAVARRREPVTGTSTYPMLGERIPDVEPGPGWGPPSAGLRRSAEPWEELRDRSDAALAADKRRPAVFLANLGPVAAFTVRSTWAKNLFEAGGIEAVGRDGYDSGDTLGAAFRASGATVACLCSDDRTYAAQGVEMAAALKAAGVQRLYLAGRPKEAEDAFKAAGVDVFVHEGLDMLALLTELHDHLGTPAPAAA